MKSLALVIPACLSINEPSAPAAMLQLVLLLSTDLDTTKPLDLHDAGHYYPAPSPPPIEANTVKGSQQGENGQLPLKQAQPTPSLTAAVLAPVPSPIPASAAVVAAVLKKLPRKTKQPGDLTGVGQASRETVQSAVYERFGSTRWGEEYGKEGHLFDMVLALHPGCRQLGYMDRLSKAPAAVLPDIKSKVYVQISRLVEGVIESERDAAAREFDYAFAVMGDGANGDVTSSSYSVEKSHKRRRVSGLDGGYVNGGDGYEDDPMASAGVFDVVPGVEGAGGSGEGGEGEEEAIPAAVEASEATKAWCAAKVI